MSACDGPGVDKDKELKEETAFSRVKPHGLSGTGDENTSRSCIGEEGFQPTSGAVAVDVCFRTMNLDAIPRPLSSSVRMTFGTSSVVYVRYARDNQPCRKHASFSNSSASVSSGGV